MTADKALHSDDVLRRYMDVPKFISLLQSSSLFLCRADRFPDRFEGSFTEGTKQLIEQSYKKYHIACSYPHFKQQLRQGVFISCLSLGIDDNMALWKLYGQSNDCVAITTTVSQMKQALDGYKGVGQLYLRRVEYIRHWKNPEILIKPYSNIFRYKTVGFSFEKEVRIILDRHHETFDADQKDEGVHIPILLNSFLRSIVASPEASPWFKRVVDEISRKYDLKCPIRTSVMAKKPI